MLKLFRKTTNYLHCMMSDNGINRSVILSHHWARFREAMTHNNPVLEDLEPTARRLMANSEAQLVLLDEQVDDLERTLRELHDSRQRKANHLHQYRTIIAPHRKLPSELLSAIFKHTVDRVELPCRTNESAFTLKLVCRKWNHAASHTLSLWTNIYIDCARATFPNIAEVGRKLFDLSGDLPLNIQLTNCALTLNALEIPRLYPTRCRNLVIEGDPKAIEDLFRLHPTDPLSSLQSLSITTTGPINSTSLPFLETAVNLRKLSIASQFRPCQAISRMPLSNVTYLNILRVHVAPPTMLAILRRCRSLATCVIRFGPFARNRPVETIFLPSLQDLLVCISLPVSYQWMDGVIMPNLVSLNLFGRDLPEHEAFRSNISHSTHLDILQITTTLATDLQPILLETPTISRLRLCTTDKYMLPTSILARLATGELLPRLSKLECVVRDAQTLGLHLDMIESRSQRSTVTSINELTFIDWGASDIEASSLSRLNTLQEGGLKVHFG